MGAAGPSAEHNNRVVLTHVGVKGMHWGVRKNSSATSSSGSPKNQSEDSVRVQSHLATINKHGPKALSNKDLQDVVTRLNLLQQYSNLSGANAKSSIDKGHETVKKILAIHNTVGQVQKALNSPLTKGMGAAFKTARAARKTAKAARTGAKAAKFVVKALT